MAHAVRFTRRQSDPTDDRWQQFLQIAKGTAKGTASDVRGGVENVISKSSERAYPAPAPRVPTAEDAMRQAASRNDMATVRSLLGMHGSNPGIPNYAEGTDYVPSTGLAMLHEGEAVVPREAAEAARNQGEGVSSDVPATKSPRADRVSTTLGGSKSKSKTGKKTGKKKKSGKSKSKHGKKVKSIRIRKAANGGYVAEHEGDSPEDNEVHQLQDMGQLQQHLAENFGDEGGGGAAPPPGPVEQPALRGGM